MLLLCGRLVMTALTFYNYNEWVNIANDLQKYWHWKSIIVFRSPCTSDLLCAIYHGISLIWCRNQWLSIQQIKLSSLDQEDVVKMMIGNNSQILNTKIAGDLPIHFAARNSEHWQNLSEKNCFVVCIKCIKLNLWKLRICRQRKHGKDFNWPQTRNGQLERRWRLHVTLLCRRRRRWMSIWIIEIKCTENVFDPLFVPKK